MTLPPIPELGDLGPDDEVDVEAILHEPITRDNSMGRALALQALYAIDTGKRLPGVALQQTLDVQDSLPSDAAREYMQILVAGVSRHRDLIDMALQHYAPEFPIKHLAVVDRNLLRIAVFEHAIAGLVPVGVAIDECVSLAKRFGAEPAPRFVNGVLGNLMDSQGLIRQLREAGLEEDDDDE